MKLKKMLATAAVVTVASSAVMAEGAYVGLESYNEAFSYVGENEIDKENSTAIYGGYEHNFNDTTELDVRISKVYGYYDHDRTTLSARISTELDNIELYGKLGTTDADSIVRGRSSFERAYALIGARYNFN